MSAKLKFIVFGAAAFILMTATAYGATVNQAIDSVWSADNVPVIFEDDDGSYLIDADASGGASLGDIVVGVVDVGKIWGGNGSIPPYSIRDIGISPPSEILGFGSANSGLQALLHAQITGFGMDANGTYFTLGAVNGATTFADPGSGPAITVGPFSTGALVQFWEDPTPEQFNLTDMSVAFANVNEAGSILLGEVGVVTASNFYNIYFSTVTGLPTGFELNVDFVGVNGFSRQIFKNDLLGDMYGVGEFLPAGGSEFAQLSDGDFKIIFAPLPAAVYPGIIAIGALILRRRTV
jgi:hypothetical protein